MQLQKNPDFSDRGASEVMGAVMLISVVVMAVAIIGVALTSQGTPQEIPALDAVISNYGSQIQIYHNGGDTLQSNQIEILVDGIATPFKKSNTDTAWTFWSPGESLVNESKDTIPPKIVRIVYKGTSGSKTILATADFSPSGMSNPGPISTSTLQAAFSNSPSSGTPPLVVGFSDLSTGSPVGWNWAFGDGGTSSGQNPTHVFGSSGTYTVSLTVTNATGSMSSVSHPITVSTSAPSVISTSPTAGTRGTNFPISIYGTGFVNGATISLKKSGSTDIAVSSVVFGSGTTLTGTLSLPAGSATGAWNVVVTNPDTKTGTLTNGFTIMDPAGPPTVSVPTPSSGTTGSTVFITDLPGTNFQTGAQVKLNSSSASDISAANITVVSPTQITCTFYLSGAATGPRNVVVTNPDGQVGMQPGGFTITSTSAPIVNSITPSSGTSGNPVSITNLAGSGFQTGATVKLNSSTLGSDIPSAGVTVVSSSQITCTFYLTGAAAGDWNVVVTNPDGQTGMKANTFTVNAVPSSAPVISTISPNSGVHNWPYSVTISGANYVSGATAKLNTTSNFAGIAATGITTTSNYMTCTFDLTSQPAQNWNVAVTNPDGKSGLLANGFTSTNPGPVVSSVVPGAGTRNTVIPVVISGTGFEPGATVTMTRNASTTAGTVSGTAVNSQTQISSSIRSTNVAAYWDIKVTNPDGQSKTLPKAFYSV
jgi:PKD repeat protein